MNVSLLCDTSLGCGNVKLTAVRISDGVTLGSLQGDTAKAVADLIGGPRRTVLFTAANDYTDCAVDFAPIGAASYLMSATRLSDGYAFPGGLTGDAACDMRSLILGA